MQITFHRVGKNQLMELLGAPMVNPQPSNSKPRLRPITAEELVKLRKVWKKKLKNTRKG